MKYSNFEILKELSKKFNGEYIEREYFHSAKAIIPYQNFNIVFDNYTKLVTSGWINIEQKYTRITVEFSSNDNFYFEINSKDILGRILSFFNKNYINTNLFEKKLLVQTNSSNKFQSIFSEENIRNRINNFDVINLQISTYKGIWGEKLPNGQYELSYFTENLIDEIDDLISVYILFKMILDKLTDFKYIQKPAANKVFPKAGQG